jgi:serine/threonine protein kinase/tetratricopeptide (TPR) repeat protein
MNQLTGQNIDHYKILEKLGEGGMGVVYKAHDTRLDRFVALKFLPSDLSASEHDKERFIREARAASALDHPNIGVVHDINDTADGKSFICMAYYPGQTLQERLRIGIVPVEAAINIALQIADGLQRAHEEGIIHRDIKPANIILTKDNIVKIVDFGLAKLTGDTKSTQSTRQFSLAGTAPYMSPEQIKGESIDFRSDLFSFGIVLYEMLTGKLPFTGEHEAAIFYAIAHMEPIRPRAIRKDIPPGLDYIILRLLRKNPAERYQGAGDVHHDLALLKTDIQKPLAPVLSRFFRLPKIYMISILLFLILAGGGIISKLIIRYPFSLAPPAYVVIADMENTTGNPFFDHSLTEAIKVSLRQSPHINLLSQDRIDEALSRMRIDPHHRLDEATAVAAAQREGAGVVIAGTIDPMMKGYIITCRIIDAENGETLKIPRREISGIDDILDGLDKLCEEIRTALGESIKEISDNAMPLQKVTTASLEALELYSRGDIMEREGNYEQAVILKGQAAGIDSQFTMAISDLSYIYRKLGQDSLAVAYHRRIPGLLDRVTAREKYAILSTYYGPSFEFDFKKAYENAREMAIRYPNDADALADFGHLAMYFCDLKTALKENERALARDSSQGSVYNNSGYAFALAGDVPDALRNFRKSKELRPTYYTIDTFIAHAQWAGGMTDSAAYTLHAIIPVGDMRRKILSYAQLATIYLSQGRLDSSKNSCDRGLSLCHQEKTGTCEAYFHYMLGKIACEKGLQKNYLSEMYKSETAAKPPYTELAMIAVDYAKNGFLHEARRIYVQISKTNSADPFFIRRRNDFLHWINGEILLEQAKTDAAVKELDAIEKVHCGDPIYMSAQWSLAMNNKSTSDSVKIRQLLGFDKMRGELIMGPLLSYPSTGAWTGHIWPETQLALGKLYISQDKISESLKHLSAARQYWQFADPEYKNALELKALMDGLQQSD